MAACPHTVLLVLCVRNVPETVREFDSAGEHEGRRRQTGRETAPRGIQNASSHTLPRQWPEMRPHHAARWGPATAAPAFREGPLPQAQAQAQAQARVRCTWCATVRPRGPVMGCIACAASPPGYAPKGPRGGQYHIQQASRRTRRGPYFPPRPGVESVRSVRLSRQERCAGAPVPVGMDLRIRIGASHSRHLRNRSSRSVGVHSAVRYGTRYRPWWARLLAEEAMAQAHPSLPRYQSVLPPLR